MDLDMWCVSTINKQGRLSSWEICPLAGHPEDAIRSVWDTGDDTIFIPVLKETNDGAGLYQDQNTGHLFVVKRLQSIVYLSKYGAQPIILLT